MTDAPVIQHNEDLNICSECGGACCKTKPGVDSPSRYLAAADPAGALQADLASGKWVLDRHYGLPPDGDRPAVPAAELTLFYPRPTMQEEAAETQYFGSAATGECALLGPAGCLLAFTDRPFMCRALQPDPRFECTTSWDRRHAALAWFHHQDLILQALERLGAQLPEDS